VFPWCTSVWHTVYYRVWQTRSTYSTPLLLLDGSEQADIGDPIHARANRKNVLIEFDIIADDAMRMPELLYYVLENGKLHRADLVALTPQDFVSFWLRSPWSEVSQWTVPAARAALKVWRERYKGTNSEFASPSRHCTVHPDLWQVEAVPAVLDPTPEIGYFLIRARAPFRFTMVAASSHPWLDCTEDDPAIDHAPDLFEESLH